MSFTAKAILFIGTCIGFWIYAEGWFPIWYHTPHETLLVMIKWLLMGAFACLIGAWWLWQEYDES